MKHHIDPKIDCVFKAILGAEENRNLVVHFLNAILGSELSAPIDTVDILNPYNDKEFLADKLSIVDVKARDRKGHLYQVEIQLLNYHHLPARILYTWADIYSQQLQSGENYGQLNPTYAIWLLAENVIKDDCEYLHAFKFRDNHGKTLIEHGGVWLLELLKFKAPHIETEQQRWLKFFTDGEQLDDVLLPEWMTTLEMRQAMGTLRQFSEKERDYHAYQARQNFLREQHSIMQEREMLLQERETMSQELETMSQEREIMSQDQQILEHKLELESQARQEALAEVERLKKLLEQNNMSQ